MAGAETRNYKCLQRFLHKVQPEEVLVRLFRKNAPFVVGDSNGIQILFRKFTGGFPLTSKNQRDRLSSEINLLEKEAHSMVQNYLTQIELVRAAGFGSAVAVDSRSAPASR
jgi:hypothetical protein